MAENFSSQFFKTNRQKLRQLFTGTAPIVMTANGLLQRSGDNTMPFSQDANFWYLTGVDDPDIVLVMDKNQDYLIIPELSPVIEFFDGAIDQAALKKTSGVDNIYLATEGWKKLSSRIKKVKFAATLAALPTYEENYRFYANPARAALASRLKSYNQSVELLDLSPHLAKLRSTKTDEEIAVMKEAINITAKAIRQASAPAKLRKYAYEYELEAELTRNMRRLGAGGQSFDPIVAGGKNACTLHSMANNSALNSGDLVLMDVGAEFNHYAGDLTRTFALSNYTKRQKAVHDATLEVQEYAIDLLAPGISMRDFEHQVELYMGEKLRSLGLIKIINSENVRRYFPSATSHFLGLSVHDAGDYNQPLEPGVVLTVEPGIYIREEGIGVRIEDDVLITDTGYTNLSQHLPKGISLI